MEFCPSSGRILATSNTPDPSVTKAFKVYNFIVSKGGEIGLSELLRHPSPLKDFSEVQAAEWLKGFSEPVQGDQPLEKPCFVLKAGSFWSVRVSLRVKLCSNYEKKGACTHGNGCLQWHVCRGYLDTTCKNKACPLSHDLLDEQNILKAKKYMLEKHPSNSIRKVLAKNLPFVCEKYMDSHQCTAKVCHDIHLCPLYARGICTNSEQDCPFSHNVDFGNNKAIFKYYGIPTKYVLAHVMIPKLITVPEKTKGDQPVAAGNITRPNRKGKVNNLNNLNTESGPFPLVNRNVPMNIEEPKKVESHKNVKREKKGNVAAQKNPLEPLMAKSIPSPLGYQQVPIALSPNPPSFGANVLQLGCNPNIAPISKAAQQHRQYFGSRDSLSSTDDDQATNKDRAHFASGAKPKRKQKKEVETQSRQEDPIPTDVASISSGQDQSKGGRNRRSRNRKKRQGSQDDSKETSQENEDFSVVDLIEFDNDDLDEGKLIDLDFDYSDPGLSQMSESQAQATWDLFCKDNWLFEDQSLNSQPAEEYPSLESLSLDEAAPSKEKIRNASVKGIFNYIVKHGGSVKFSEICSNPDLWDPRFTEHEQWFKERNESFLLAGGATGNIDELKAISWKAKMCLKYNARGAGCTQENCPYFHICKDYITYGRCPNFHGSCKKNHGFKDGHNRAIASKLIPDNDFSSKQLRQLLISSTPQVCMDYNNLRCKQGNRCLKVHVCKNIGYKKCPKAQCKLAHENGLKSPRTRALLAKLGIRFHPKINLFMLAKTLLVVNDAEAHPLGKSSESNQKETEKPVTSVSKTDILQYNIKAPDIGHPICLAFLVGKCNKGTKCSDHHCPLPYQWVYLSGQQWRMLDQKENEDLEKLFCEDNINDECVVISLKLDLSTKPEFSHMNNVSYIYNVDLKTMNIESLDDEGLQVPVKRLSTDSDVVVPGCQLATTWQWYWKNEHNIYVEYEPFQGCKEPTSISIERFYQEGMSRYDFMFGRHEYRLYFNDMIQKNMDVHFLTERKVIRRPVFVRPGKVNHLKRNCTLPNIAASTQVPSHWKKMTDDQPFLLKRLNTNSKEFKNIKSLFVNSMGDYTFTVSSIDRVQNPFMWEKYRRKKEQMEKHSDNKQVDERQLFHGTSYKNIRSICKENFDWRLYGEVTGNKYGEGAYFARDASFSHCYCHDDEDGIRFVFVAKVLVGSFTKGEKNYRRPPPKNPDDPHSEHYNSCVDNVNNPQVFVGFDVDQYYPEYVIEYKCEPTLHASSHPGYAVKSSSYSTPNQQRVSMPTSSSSNFASYSPNPSPTVRGPSLSVHMSPSQGVSMTATTSPRPTSCPSYDPSEGPSFTLTEQRIKEEIGKFEQSAKKNDCAVM